MGLLQENFFIGTFGSKSLVFSRKKFSSARIPRMNEFSHGLNRQTSETMSSTKPIWPKKIMDLPWINTKHPLNSFYGHPLRARERK